MTKIDDIDICQIVLITACGALVKPITNMPQTSNSTNRKFGILTTPGAPVPFSTRIIFQYIRWALLSVFFPKRRQIVACLIVGCNLLLTSAYGRRHEPADTPANLSKTIIKRNIIRLSFLDRLSPRKNKPQKEVQVNGLNFSMVSNVTVINGINFGLLLVVDSICNGIQFGGLAAIPDGRVNGIAVGGIETGAKTINGLAVAPIAIAEKINGLGLNLARIADTMNGCFFGSWGDFSKNDEGEGNVKGCMINMFVTRVAALSGLNISSLANINHLKGLSISAFNRSDDLAGIQIGLWNVAKNNKHFKALPLINCNFSRAAAIQGQSSAGKIINAGN